MGMAEQKKVILALYILAKDENQSPIDRIIAWHQWGLFQKDAYGAAVALRNIGELARSMV